MPPELLIYPLEIFSGLNIFFPVRHTSTPVNPVIGLTFVGEGSPVPLCTGVNGIVKLANGFDLFVLNDKGLPVAVYSFKGAPVAPFRNISLRSVDHSLIGHHSSLSVICSTHSLVYSS